MITYDYPSGDPTAQPPEYCISDDIYTLPTMWLAAYNGKFMRISPSMQPEYTGLRQFDLSPSKIVIKIDENFETRKLKARWTYEAEQDLLAMHGPSEQLRIQIHKGINESRFNDLIQDQLNQYVSHSFMLIHRGIVDDDITYLNANGEMVFHDDEAFHFSNKQEKFVIAHHDGKFGIRDLEREEYRVMDVPDIVEAKLSYECDSILLLTKKNIVIIDNPLMD